MENLDEKSPYFQNLVYQLNADGLPLEKARDSARRIIKRLKDSISFRAEMKILLVEENQ